MKGGDKKNRFAEFSVNAQHEEALPGNPCCVSALGKRSVLLTQGKVKRQQICKYDVVLQEVSTYSEVVLGKLGVILLSNILLQAQPK